MLARKPIDLRLAPKEVTWVQLDGSDEDRVTRRFKDAQWKGKDSEDRVLVIGDNKDTLSRHQIASQTPGATVVEPVDLKDMVAFAATFNLSARNALERIVYFAETIMSNVGAKCWQLASL